MRCVQVRNDEEEWERIRTNHEGLLWETRTSFYKENYDLTYNTKYKYKYKKAKKIFKFNMKEDKKES